MCWIKLAACLSVFQCKSSIVSYRIVSWGRGATPMVILRQWNVRLLEERGILTHLLFRRHLKQLYLSFYQHTQHVQGYYS